MAPWSLSERRGSGQRPEHHGGVAMAAELFSWCGPPFTAIRMSSLAKPESEEKKTNNTKFHQNSRSAVHLTELRAPDHWFLCSTRAQDRGVPRSWGLGLARRHPPDFRS